MQPENAGRVGVDVGFCSLFAQGFKHRSDCLRISMSAQVGGSLCCCCCGKAWLSFWPNTIWTAVITVHGSVVSWLQSKHNWKQTASLLMVPNPCKRSYDSLLKAVHKNGVITTADKLGNAHVTVCKKHHVASAFADLDSSQFYSGVPDDGWQYLADVAAELNTQV